MPIWLGIDIGASAVKVVAIRSAYRKTTLEALVRVDIVRGEDGAEVGSALKSAVDTVLASVGAPDAVAVAVDGARSTVRTVTLPAGAIKQVADVLPFELEAQIPFEMSEAVFDYRALPRTPKIDGVESFGIPLLVGVARTEEVATRISAARDVTGVEPERVGLGALPLANVMAVLQAEGGDRALSSESAPVIVIDLGARTSEILILVGGEPVFARTLSQGTARIETTAPLLAREIRLTIGSFRSLGGGAPERIYLCGGGSFRSGAHTFLSGELDLPCLELPPVALEMGLGVPPERIAEMPWFAKALGLSLGLGARPLDLDLRKGPLAFERGFAWIREKIPVLAGLSMVVLVSFFFSAWAQLHAASQDHDSVEKALGLVTKDVLGEETTSAARANELVSQQTTLNDDDPLPHADAFDVMVKLSEDIPPVTVTSDIEELDVQKGHVVVHGIVGSIPDAQSIADAMRKEHCFTDVKISRTNQVFGENRQKYLLELDEKCPEDVRGSKKKDSSAAPAASSSGGR
jgi:general secretion pathway protein L